MTDDPLTIAFAVLVGTVATARLTRLIVHDTYPPAAWLRDRWRALVRNGEWSNLVDCHWCAAPYVAAVVLAAALLSDLAAWWWIIAGWLAGSYAAAYIVEHDDRE